MSKSRQLKPEEEAEIDRAAEDVQKPEEPQVPSPVKSKAPASSLKVHTTVPVEQSLAKIKKRHKPRKVAEAPTENNENAEIKTGSKPRSGPSPDAGKSGGFVLPIDFFRK